MRLGVGLGIEVRGVRPGRHAHDGVEATEALRAMSQVVPLGGVLRVASDESRVPPKRR